MVSESNKLRDSFGTAMESHREELEKRGVTFTDIEYDVRSGSEGALTSEVRVSFFQSGELVDVFEFHLFRNGEQLVTAGDIESWVNKNIHTVGV